MSIAMFFSYLQVVREPHHFDPAPGRGAEKDAAPAPARKIYVNTVWQKEYHNEIKYYR
jgi:hypothetical protein